MASLSKLKYLLYIGSNSGFVTCITSANELVWREKLHKRIVVSIQVAEGVVVSASDDRTLAVVDKNTGKMRFRLKGHMVEVNRVVLANGVVISVSDDSTAKVWSLTTGKCLKTLTDHTSYVCGVATHGDWFATCSSDQTIKLYSMTTYALQATLVNGRDVNTVAFLDDGCLVSGDVAKTVTIWDIKAKRKVREMKGHPNYLWTVTVLDNGLVASGDRRGGIKLWDPDTGTCLRNLNGHTNQIDSICDNGNGTVTSASSDGIVRRWDIATGRLLSTIDPPNPIYNSMDPYLYGGFESSCVAVDGSTVRAMLVSASVRVQYKTHPALQDATGLFHRFPNELVACVACACSPVELMHLLGVCRRTYAHVVDNVLVRMLKCCGDKAKLRVVSAHMSIRHDVVGWWQSPRRSKHKRKAVSQGNRAM